MPAFIVTAVDAGQNTLTSPGVALTGEALGTRLLTGDRLRLRNLGGALPAATPALAPVTDLFAIRVDDNTIRVAVSSADAMAGTPVIDITSSGSGTHVIQFGLPYAIPRVSAPGVQHFSRDNNATWEAMVALYGLLTGQAQSVWDGVQLAGALTTNGARVVGGAITPTTITDSAVHANFAPTGFATCGVIRQVITGTNVPTYGGLAGGTDGRVVYVICLGATANDQLGLAHEDVTSTAANRFSLPGATGLQLPQFGAVSVRYDGVASRWHLLSKSF
jgi:hypothetical protein